MSKKVKKHPTITETSANVLKQSEITESEALERYAIYIATNDHQLAVEYNLLQEQKNLLEQDIETLQKRLQNVEEKLKKIEKSKQGYNPVETSNYQDALYESTKLLANVQKMIDSKGVYGVKKVTLSEIRYIAEMHHVPVQMVLQGIDQTLLKTCLDRTKG